MMLHHCSTFVPCTGFFAASTYKRIQIKTLYKILKKMQQKSTFTAIHSYSVGEASRIRELSLFQESENWISLLWRKCQYMAAGKMESWPKRLFILWSIFFMFIIFLCSKLLLENVNIVQTFDAIPFLLCRLFPCQPLNGIKQIYAQYIWREFFPISNISKPWETWETHWQGWET